MPRLDLYLNYELQATVKLDADEVIVGRDADCALCIPDPTVSRVHAVIRSRDMGHSIENKGINGTKVNGKKLEDSQQLKPGDAIFVSKYILIYQSDEAPAADAGRTIMT